MFDLGLCVSFIHVYIVCQFYTRVYCVSFIHVYIVCQFYTRVYCVSVLYTCILLVSFIHVYIVCQFYTRVYCVSVLYTCILCVSFIHVYIVCQVSTQLIVTRTVCYGCNGARQMAVGAFMWELLAACSGAEFGSTEKEELVRYTRRLEVVQGYSKG